ncbi:MAG: response regulator transcription factor [Tepidisphaera sp.]
MTSAVGRSPGGRIRVLSVSEGGASEEALERRIAGEPELEWLGVCRTQAEAYTRIKEQRPDIILLAIEMGGVRAADLAHALSRVSPGSRVVMTIACVTPEAVEQAVDCGAWGLWCREDEVSRIVEGIRSAARGEISLAREANEAQRLADHRLMHGG